MRPEVNNQHGLRERVADVGDRGRGHCELGVDARPALRVTAAVTELAKAI
jgi:hypothetical protein